MSADAPSPFSGLRCLALLRQEKCVRVTYCHAGVLTDMDALYWCVCVCMCVCKESNQDFDK